MPTTEGWEDDLSDGALEARLRLFAHHLQALSRKELVEVIVGERQRRVLDRRYFLTMLMHEGVAIHAMAPDEWGSGAEDAEVEPLDEDELTILLGRSPSGQDVERYLLHLDATANGPDPEDLVEWALGMPDC